MERILLRRGQDEQCHEEKMWVGMRAEHGGSEPRYLSSASRWIHILAPGLAGCVTLGKLLALSVHQLLPQYNEEGNNGPCLSTAPYC